MGQISGLNSLPVENICVICSVEPLWDDLRKKWVADTPEERVRLQVVQGLLRHGIPASSIGVEKKVAVYGRLKRFDLLVFRQGKPWMVVECKAPSVRLDQTVYDQLFSYRHALGCPLALATNGVHHHLFEYRPDLPEGMVALPELPTFAE